MSNKLKKYIVPAIALVIMLAGAFVYPFRNTVSVQTIYNEVMTGEGARVYWDLGQGLDIANSKFTEMADYGSTVILKHHVDEFTQLAIAPTDNQEICGIRCFNIAANEHSNYNIPAAEIETKFVPVGGAGYYDDEADIYYFLPIEEEAYLVMDQPTYLGIVGYDINLDDSAKMRNRVAVCVLFIVILSAIMFNFSKIESFLDSIFSNDKDINKTSIFVPVAICAFVVATLTVIIIGMRSDLGVHPDEWDVFECLKYGMTHILPPDIRAEGVGDTFSGYGYTKLANGTYYFLIAGKVALITKYFFELSNWFRIPNILLFLGMGYIYIKNIKRKNFLVLALGISVQAFYIFSYVTADALDFFWSFLVLMLLTDEDSMLFSFIKEGINKKNAYKGILLGVLFGMVMIGKQNYWAVLLLAFVVLLLKLIYAPKEEKSKLWKAYIFVIAFFIVTVGTRFAFDFAHYGFNEKQIKHEYDIKYASYDKNPETPKQDRCVTYRMYENGYALPDLFMESNHWFRDTFHSFCGLLEDYEMSQVYYTVMGFLYIFVILMLAGLNFKPEIDKDKKIETVIMLGLLALSVIVSILNSYFSDSMAQGRYLLPMGMVLAYMGYRTPEAFDKKYFRAAVLIINVLCVWYFATRGVKMSGVTPM